MWWSAWWGVDLGCLHRQCDDVLMGARHPAASWQGLAGRRAVVLEALMVTVEVDPARVESRLAAGEIGCPSCVDGVLGGWGHARPRRVVGVADPVRPRRARCRACAVTHVLLPVTLLLRRAYAAELDVGGVGRPKAAGSGHRRIARTPGGAGDDGAGLAARVRGRLQAVRAWFIEVAVTAGVDVTMPDATGRWRGVLAAVATAAVRDPVPVRRGAVLGAVTPRRVAVVVQRWSAARAGMAAAASGGADQHESALTIGGAEHVILAEATARHQSLGRA